MKIIPLLQVCTQQYVYIRLADRTVLECCPRRVIHRLAHARVQRQLIVDPVARIDIPPSASPVCSRYAEGIQHIVFVRIYTVVPILYIKSLQPQLQHYRYSLHMILHILTDAYSVSHRSAAVVVAHERGITARSQAPVAERIVPLCPSTVRVDSAFSATAQLHQYIVVG